MHTVRHVELAVNNAMFVRGGRTRWCCCCCRMDEAALTSNSPLLRLFSKKRASFFFESLLLLLAGLLFSSRYMLFVVWSECEDTQSRYIGVQQTERIYAQRQQRLSARTLLARGSSPMLLRVLYGSRKSVGVLSVGNPVWPCIMMNSIPCCYCRASKCPVDCATNNTDRW